MWLLGQVEGGGQEVVDTAVLLWARHCFIKTAHLSLMLRRPFCLLASELKMMPSIIALTVNTISCSKNIS